MRRKGEKEHKVNKKNYGEGIVFEDASLLETGRKGRGKVRATEKPERGKVNGFMEIRENGRGKWK